MVVDELEGALGQLSQPQRLIDQVAPIVHRLATSSDLDAWEWAEANLGKIKEEIVERQEDARIKGVTWTIELIGRGADHVRGTSFPDLSMSEREQAIRSYRKYASKISDFLDGISWREFETACTQILRLMGCKNPVTSPPSDDGGIDFYGRLELEGRLDDSFPYGGIDRRVHVWLIGQAKFYNNRKVSPGEVRELVGSVELARTGGAVHKWPGLDLRPFDPVVQLLFTTGSFAPRARDLLENTGVVSMDKAQLATFVADTGIGIDPDSQSFDSARLRTCLLDANERP